MAAVRGINRIIGMMTGGITRNGAESLPGIGEETAGWLRGGIRVNIVNYALKPGTGILAAVRSPPGQSTPPDSRSTTNPSTHGQYK